VLLSQLRYIISFLFLFGSLFSLFLVYLCLVSSATSTCLTSKVDNLYHVLKLDVVSKSFKQFSILSQDSYCVSLQKAVKRNFLKFCIIGIN